METAQERELLQLQLQGWPFHAMPPSFDAGSGYTYSGSSISSGGGDGFLLGWEPPFGCFGVVPADALLHDLFPLCMDSLLPVSPAATSTAPALPSEPHVGAVAMPNGELGDLLLLQNFWDASSAYDEQPVAINSSCCAVQHEKSGDHQSSYAATASNNSFHFDDDDPLGSIFSKRPTLSAEPVFQATAAEEEPLLSSSSSSSHGADPHASDSSGAQTQDTTTGPSSARAPPPPRSSLKRATPEGALPCRLSDLLDATRFTVITSTHSTNSFCCSVNHARVINGSTLTHVCVPVSESAEAECSQSGVGKRRKDDSPAPARRVVCPFALLKPDGLDGGATLADINARNLMRPARPVRHPVGEFACAPRVLSVDVPGISGRAVSGFTRLHTPGRGTITIMRTRG
ncbi:unnamed protein product [Alopecurus aequalis]